MSGVDQLTYYPFINAAGPLPTNSQACLFDTLQGMSNMNAKNYEYTDRSGNLQGVLCDVTITSNVPVSAKLVTVPNSWKTRNATRKFHFERDDMFDRAGISKGEMGKYGKTIRPYFDLCHFKDEGLTTGFSYWTINPVAVLDACPTEADGFSIVPVKGGEWTRTMLTAADPSPLVNAVPVDHVESADTWNIHLCDGHDTAEVPWGSVGMIRAYNEDRMEVVTPASGETVTANNPLALLASQSVTGGEAVGIAEDQELEATPYDIADGGDSTQKIQIGDMRVVPYSDISSGEIVVQSSTMKNVFLPAGYLAIWFSKMIYGPASEAANYLSVEFDIHGIVDCKDWIEA